MATASHELKTPITSIKAYAQILEQDLPKMKAIKAKQLAMRINYQVDHLIRLVEDLVDVRLRRYQVNFHCINQFLTLTVF